MNLNEKLDWTLDSYTADFLHDDASHRDARHALLHVMKATGHVAAQLEALDHKNAKLSEPALAAHLADIVICAVRIAQTMPVPLNLEGAVAARLVRNVAVHRER